MANTSAPAKTHVSLRLPTYILESIDAHAEKENISRTEAFVHYLQTGLDISDEKANEPSVEESLFQSISNELAEIKSMLEESQFVAAEGKPKKKKDKAAKDEAHLKAVAEAADTEEAAREEVAREEAEAEAEMVAAAEADMGQQVETATSVYSKDTDEDMFMDSDAVAEPSASAEPTDEDMFTGSDAISEPVVSEVAEEPAEAEENEAITSVPGEADDDFTCSDEVVEAIAEESAEDSISLKKIEKAVAAAAKQISGIEKIWLYGEAAQGDKTMSPVLDLCIKTEGDKKIKGKNLDALIATIEEKTGKVANVVLKHDVKGKELKQALKDKVQVFKA